MKRTVTIYSGGGISQYTAYAGASITQAQAHIDTARNALVMTRGTATILYRENDKLKTSIPVVDGEFTVEDF